jgi:hypothetical protein
MAPSHVTPLPPPHTHTTPRPRAVYNDGDATLKKTLGEAMLKNREGGGGGGMGGMGGGFGGGFGEDV